MAEHALRNPAAQPVADPPATAVAGHAETNYGGNGHGAHNDGHDSNLHHHFDDMKQQREATSLGMWGFLSTEVMMFGGLFFVYSLYRWKFENAAHLAQQLNPYFIGSRMLNEPVGFVNTLVLLASSLTMALAVHSAQMRNKKLLITFLSLTWVLGLTFLVVKGFEWTADYHEGLIPSINWNPAETIREKGFDPSHVNLTHMQMFFMIYFCMTGLHAIHMIIGLGIVGYFIWMARRNHFTRGDDQAVELVGLYWHFVDIVWVFLFPLLYLIAGKHVI